MIEDGVYPWSVPSFLLGDDEFKTSRTNPSLGMRWPVVNLDWFHVVDQVVLNWFTGVPNPTQVRGLDEIITYLLDD